MAPSKNLEVVRVRVILHPMVVHFPIALLVTGLAFELVGFLRKEERWRQFAGYLLLLGWLGLLLAVGTGFITGEAGETGEGGENVLVESHQRWGYAAVAAFGLLLLLRRAPAGALTPARAAGLLLVGAVALGTLVGTGHTGGTIVYGPIMAREGRESGEMRGAFGPLGVPGGQAPGEAGERGLGGGAEGGFEGGTEGGFEGGLEGGGRGFEGGERGFEGGRAPAPGLEPGFEAGERGGEAGEAGERGLR